jgi:hypothetical protein
LDVSESILWIYALVQWLFSFSFLLLISSLQILHNAPCANSTYFDRSVSFPIFSGLFVVLKMGKYW